jgi:hypothetical protein
MKKFLLIIVLAVVLLGIVIPQFFLDAAYAMDRSTVIDAKPAAITRVVADLRTWDSWTAWNSEVDPTIARAYTGTPGEPGHKMTWTSDELDNGSLEITTIEPTRVAYKMRIDGWDPSNGAFVMKPAADGTTTVKWEFSGEINGFPAKRYFGLMMDRMVGGDFEEGLTKLKAKVEGLTASPDPQGE